MQLVANVIFYSICAYLIGYVIYLLVKIYRDTGKCSVEYLNPILTSDVQVTITYDKNSGWWNWNAVVSGRHLADSYFKTANEARIAAFKYFNDYTVCCDCRTKVFDYQDAMHISKRYNNPNFKLCSDCYSGYEAIALKDQKNEGKT